MISSELETPEDGLTLKNREDDEEKPQKRGSALRIARDEATEYREQLEAIQERIAKARRLALPPQGHCRDCWQRGARAAADFIEGK